LDAEEEQQRDGEVVVPRDVRAEERPDASSATWNTWPMPTEMTVITASAPNVPANTLPLLCCVASSTAMKNVLSPISLKKMRRNADRKPSVSEPEAAAVSAALDARSDASAGAAPAPSAASDAAHASATAGDGRRATSPVEAGRAGGAAAGAAAARAATAVVARASDARTASATGDRRARAEARSGRRRPERVVDRTLASPTFRDSCARAPRQMPSGASTATMARSGSLSRFPRVWPREVPARRAERTGPYRSRLLRVATCVARRRSTAPSGGRGEKEDNDVLGALSTSQIERGWNWSALRGARKTRRETSSTRRVRC